MPADPRSKSEEADVTLTADIKSSGSSPSAHTKSTLATCAATPSSARDNASGQTPQYFCYMPVPSGRPDIPYVYQCVPVPVHNGVPQLPPPVPAGMPLPFAMPYMNLPNLPNMPQMPNISQMPNMSTPNMPSIANQLPTPQPERPADGSADSTNGSDQRRVDPRRPDQRASVNPSNFPSHSPGYPVLGVFGTPPEDTKEKKQHRREMDGSKDPRNMVVKVNEHSRRDIDANTKEEVDNNSDKNNMEVDNDAKDANKGGNEAGNEAVNEAGNNPGNKASNEAARMASTEAANKIVSNDESGDVNADKDANQSNNESRNMQALEELRKEQAKEELDVENSAKERAHTPTGSPNASTDTPTDTPTGASIDRREETYEDMQTFAKALAGMKSAEMLKKSPNRPHPCKLRDGWGRLCKRRFVRPYDLLRHQETVHGTGDAKTYQCALCGSSTKRFSRSDSLSRHIRRMHRMDPEVVRKMLDNSSALPAIHSKRVPVRDLLASQETDTEPMDCETESDTDWQESAASPETKKEPELLETA